MAPLCGICASNPPKYRCPQCQLPYCSIPCYRTHKSSSHAEQSPSQTSPSLHPSDTTTNASITRETEPAQAQAQPPQPIPLLQNPDLQPLLAKYPALKHRLRDIYLATGGQVNKASETASGSNAAAKSEVGERERAERDVALFFGGRDASKGARRGRDGGAAGDVAKQKARERETIGMVGESEGLEGMREFRELVVGGKGEKDGEEGERRLGLF